MRVFCSGKECDESVELEVPENGNIKFVYVEYNIEWMFLYIPKKILFLCPKCKRIFENMIDWSN